MKLFTLFLALTSVFSFNVTGQPLTNHGPSEVYYVEDIVEGNDGRIFLSTAGGLYYSDDMGDEWQVVNAQMNTVYFHPYFAKNNSNGDLYAWDLEDGIYSTSDNGATWNFQIIPMPGGIQMTALAIDGDTLIIGTKSGLYFVKGTDFIRHPTEITALNGKELIDLHVFGETVIAIAKSGEILVSSDLGKQWDNKANGLPSNFVVEGITCNGTLWYVYGAPNGIYFSDDAGSNWHPMNNGMNSVQTRRVVVDSDQLYAATYTYDNVYKWNSGLNSWSLIDNGIPNETLPNVLYVRGENIIVGGWHGVFKSKDGGVSYERSQNGITDAFVFRTIEVAADGTIWAMGSHTGVYRMQPGEANFTLLPEVVWSGNFGSSLLNGNILPIVQDYRTKLYDVIDNSWKEEYQYINVPFPDKFLQTAQGIFLSSRTEGIFRYTGTTSFIRFNDGLTSLAVKEFVDIGEKMLAATEDGLYIRGAADPQWERIYFSSQDQGVHRLFIQGNRYILTAADFNVYISNNGGETWELVDDLKSKYVTAYTASENGTLYAAASGAIYISIDGGAHWVKREIPFAEVNAMAIKDDNLLLATMERGIWSTSLKVDQVISFVDPPETIGQQSTYTLSATTTSGLSVNYTVVSGPGIIEGNILTVTGEGDIVVKASQPGNDVFNPSTIEYTFRTETVTSIEEVGESSLSVYPNPVSKTITVVPSNASDYGSIRLIGPQGHIVLWQQGQGAIELPVENLPSGLYYLQYSNSRETVTQKVVKK